MHENILTGEYISVNGEEETEKLAQRIAGMIRGGELITLDGELGSGKTFFTGAFCEGLGIKRTVICSPTYTIMRKIEGQFTIYHWDFYRAGSIDELVIADFFELINEKNTVNIIEWASLFRESWENCLPRIEIKIEFGEKDEQRRIRAESKT
ncbi:MAG TPA: tRNA (adenosine(37)-N6)-threonylcarbamoyltransferase complex ATPase subunit type 1 TsaE [bacterium]|nr:tRNA (adenosine(37)-N6)-threonylcarbamoyltransferase complex ATPase subunit type 1 TsaE [bacterium]